jgi:hypothetical protein
MFFLAALRERGQRDKNMWTSRIVHLLPSASKEQDTKELMRLLQKLNEALDRQITGAKNRRNEGRNLGILVSRKKPKGTSARYRTSNDTDETAGEDIDLPSVLSIKRIFSTVEFKEC